MVQPAISPDLWGIGMQAGDFFNERYIVEGILGKGGMGTVYLARNINTDTYWAIKEIDMRSDRQINLAAEPNLLKKLDHPALPRLFDIIEQDGFLYMISDYIDGVSLDKKLTEEGRFAEEIVVDWGIQLCKALDYLHSIRPNPIIYRDIKPSNIMLTEKGKLKLIDFGTAREYKPQSDADTVYIGTRGYAAPEQFGTGQTSAVSDIYSMGITLHHLLTGKSPVEAPYKLRPIRYYDRQLSAELEAIIGKCTSEAMEDRYQSVLELMEDLLALQEALYSNGSIYRSGKIGDITRGAYRYGGREGGSDKPGRDGREVERGVCTANAEWAPDGCIVDDYARNSSTVDELARNSSAVNEYGPFSGAPDGHERNSRHLHTRKKRSKAKRQGDDGSGTISGNAVKRYGQSHSFRRQVITVWDNAEFACELAYTAAKYTGGSVVLIDLDLLAPKADLILNTSKFPVGTQESGALGHSGLDIVIDAVTRGVLTSALLRQAAIVRNDMKNLYIITGNYKLNNFEYYSEESVPQIIEKCYRSFDITILMVNRSIYDAFTLAALLRSDVNIAAVGGDISSLREFNTYIAFLNEKQRLPLENTKFVLFEHDRSCDMSEAETRQATQDNLLGSISYSRKRSMYRNIKGAYASHMEKEVLAEYYRIHGKLGLVPAVSLLQKLLRLSADIFTGSRDEKGAAREV
jgi:serine/threonine-protein kinase